MKGAFNMGKRFATVAFAFAFAFAFFLAFAAGLPGCSAPSGSASSSSGLGEPLETRDAPYRPSSSPDSRDESASASSSSSASPSTASAAESALASLDITQDFRASFDHGPKTSEYQKYIVLHDTEGEGTASGVIDYWEGNGAGVAAHFVVNKDGSIWQCVPLDRIAHHAGFGDAGHNELYSVAEDGRDDMVGTVPIGDWAPDYGMNAWSVGIEMVHVGGAGSYPEEQLEALDGLIAYIDSHYGFESQIIDHKAWRSGNSDTSPEFASYLANYQDHRTHL